MDPVSHSVIGRAIVAATGRRLSAPGSGAAAILGALSPDVDFVLMPFGWDIYLRAHAAGTHSIAGALLTGAGSAILIRLCVRRSTLRPLLGAGAIGALTHIASDIMAGARLQPAWPFITQTVSLPLVAMGDPWTIAVTLAGGWMMWQQRLHLERGARRAVLAIVLFLAVKAALLGVVVSRVDADDGEPATDRIVEARWAALTDWVVFERQGSQLRRRLISLQPATATAARATLEAGIIAASPALLLAIDIPPETALTRASKSLPSVRNFLAVHELAFPVERANANGTRSVLWSDIRFCWRDDDARLACGLWFGGVFDSAGRPLMQTVHVGSWIQERAP
jgi:membrane-bound metal-dependent hydrolase YbcI (DUF457 family)